MKKKNIDRKNNKIITKKRRYVDFKTRNNVATVQVHVNTDTLETTIPAILHKDPSQK